MCATYIAFSLVLIMSILMVQHYFFSYFSQFFRIHENILQGQIWITAGGRLFWELRLKLAEVLDNKWM